MELGHIEQLLLQTTDKLVAQVETKLLEICEQLKIPQHEFVKLWVIEVREAEMFMSDEKQSMDEYRFGFTHTYTIRKKTEQELIEEKRWELMKAYGHPDWTADCAVMSNEEVLANYKRCKAYGRI